MSDELPQELAQLRISDGERDRAIDALTGHYVEGRLDLEEFDERSSRITSARSFGEIEPAFAGLPGGMPFTLGGDGRPVLAEGVGAPARETAPPGPQVAADSDDRQLEALARKGRIVKQVASIGGVITLAVFFALMFAHVPFFWVVWPLYAVVVGVVRLSVGLSRDDERIYGELRRGEDVDRQERLRIAMERRRGLDRP